MAMVIKTNKNHYKGQTTTTSAGTISFDKDGVAQITDEQYQILSHPRFEFMGLYKAEQEVKVYTEPTTTNQSDEIKKIEQNEFEQSEVTSQTVTQSEQSNPEMVASEPVENETQQETATSQTFEQQVDNELIEEIKGMRFKSLQKVAKELDLPETEWEAIRVTEDLRQYVLKNISE